MGIGSFIKKLIPKKSEPTPKATPTPNQYSSPIGPPKPSPSGSSGIGTTSTGGTYLTPSGGMSIAPGGSVPAGSIKVGGTPDKVSFAGKTISGGGGTSSINSGKQIQGPLPQGTTPSQEKLFRETGITPQAKLTQEGKDIPSAPKTFQTPRYDYTKDIGIRVGRGQTFGQDVKSIASTMATPFKPAYKKTSEYVGKGVQKLSVVEQKIRAILQPQSREEAHFARETASFTSYAEKFAERVEDYNTRAENLKSESAIIDKINEGAVAVYNAKVEQLQSEEKRLSQQKQIISQQQLKLEKKGERLNIEKERNPTVFAGALITGIVLTPVALIKLGAGLITSPVRTVKEQVTGITQIPKGLATAPMSYGGELAGGIIGAVLTGRIVGSALKRTPNVPEEVALKNAVNQRLGITNKVDYKSVGYNKEISLRNNLLESGAFSDTNVQSLIRSGEIGKATKIGPSGTKSSRLIIKQKIGGQEYILTFRESSSGGISAPRLAVVDEVSKTANVYKPTLKDADIVQRTGTYARRNVIASASVKELPSGEILRATRQETQIAKVGYGSKRPILLKDLLQRKQIEVVKKVKYPKVSEVSKTKTIELIKPAEEINLVAKNQFYESMKKIGEQQRSKYVSRSDITQVKPIEFEKIKEPKITSEKNSAKIFADEINKVIKNSEARTPIIQISKQISEPMTSLGIRELGFDISKASSLKTPSIKTPKQVPRNVLIPPKVTGRISNDLIKKTEQSSGIINLDKLQTNIKGKQKSVSLNATRIINKPAERTATSLASLSAVKPLQIQKLKQVQISELEQIPQQIVQIPTLPRTPTPKIPEFPFPFVFPATPRDAGSKKAKLFMKKLTPRKAKYTASLGAAFFQAKPIGVSRKEFERLSKATYTGIETRPVLEIVEDEDTKKIRKGLKALNI